MLLCKIFVRCTYLEIETKELTPGSFVVEFPLTLIRQGTRGFNIARSWLRYCDRNSFLSLRDGQKSSIDPSSGGQWWPTLNFLCLQLAAKNIIHSISLYPLVLFFLSLCLSIYLSFFFFVFHFYIHLNSFFFLNLFFFS